jgi:hypothetical protein
MDTEAHMIEEIRKYGIFISSSFIDLKEARSKIINNILQLGHIPMGMEFLTAGGDTRDVISSEIKACDFFLLILGSRFGAPITGEGDGSEEHPSMSPEEYISFTRWEFREAVAQKKPILAFLLEETEYKHLRSEIPDYAPEASFGKALDALRNEAESGGRLVQFFSSKDISDLAGKIALALQVHLPSSGHKGGWVRGELYDKLAERIVIESPGQNRFFTKFAKRLSDVPKVTHRVQFQELLKTAIASAFWTHYLPRFTLRNVWNLYFESGSSIAYLSEAFIANAQSSQWIDISKYKILTNNVLSFLDFTLMEIEPNGNTFDIGMQPHGRVDANYGATFGDLMKAVQLPPPAKPRGLHPTAALHLNRFVGRLKDFFAKSGAILMTASGIETNPDSEFYGPHVGSYYNQLVKRALLSVGCPTVLFLDENKLPYPFRVGICYPVCGPDFEWKTLVETIPLSIAIATHSNNLDERLKLLDAMGFHHHEPILEKDGIASVIAGNDLFKKEFSDESMQL